MAKKNDEKTCWACTRIIEGEAKFGLCQGCINKYGTPAAVVGTLGLGVGVKYVAKNGGKIVKTVANIAKKIKI